MTAGLDDQVTVIALRRRMPGRHQQWEQRIICSDFVVSHCGSALLGWLRSILLPTCSGKHFDLVCILIVKFLLCRLHIATL